MSQSLSRNTTVDAVVQLLSRPVPAWLRHCGG